MAFTDHEKARIKHFLAYPNWASMAQSIQLGYPAASQPAFLVDDSFHRQTPEGEACVRRDLCELEQIESQMSQARGRFKATEMAGLKLNANEMAMLEREYGRWRSTLASDLGVVTNPYSQTEHLGFGGAGGGRNATVID